MLAQELEKATALHQSGNINEAVKIYERLLKTNQNDVQLLYFYSIGLLQLNKTQKAIKILEKFALGKIENDLIKESKTILAECYMRSGNLSKAEVLLKEVIEVSPSDFMSNVHLGAIYLANKKFNDSIQCYRRALRAGENEKEIYKNLIKAYIQKDDNQGVISCFLALIEMDAKDPELYFQVATYYTKVRDYENAYKAYKNAVFLKDDFAEAHLGLGDIYLKCHDFDKAREHLGRSLELNSKLIPAYYNMTCLYTETGEVDKIFELCEQGLDIEPGNRHLLFNIARGKLLDGNWSEGWDYFELRRDINEKKQYGKYLLDYQGSLEEKSVLVYWDSGFGDVIQFLRYVKLLKEQCKKVYLRIQDPLIELVEANDFGVEIIPKGKSLSGLEYDFHINTTSLTHLYPPQEDKIHLADKYLSVPKSKLVDYKNKNINDNDKFKVGILWYSHVNTFRKNVEDLNEFAPIANIPNVELYSLQQTKDMPMFDGISFDIKNLGDDFDSFLDTAAAIESMDLIVMIDTAAAHLAGAMGKPVFTLLPKIPNWRWAMTGDDTPWYDSMKLFRQVQEDSWGDVIEKIAQEIRQKIASN